MFLMFKCFIQNEDELKIFIYGTLYKRVKTDLSKYFYANSSSNRVQKKMIYDCVRIFASKRF